jgi:hypothetical protein
VRRSWLGSEGVLIVCLFSDGEETLLTVTDLSFFSPSLHLRRSALPVWVISLWMKGVWS